MKKSILVLGWILLCFVSFVQAHNPPFTRSFNIEDCSFSSIGRNPYFVLVPGFQTVYEGLDEGEPIRLVITVLDKTRIINGVETRVILEHETNRDSGEPVEISRNYFAICKKTNSAFYFGESVDIYENGEVASHDGSWEAGKDGAEPGIIMPGTVLLGARHYQELAPGVALDRAEILSMTDTVTTPGGTFPNCLKVKETSDLTPGAEYKWYAKGIGGVRLDQLLLVGVTDPAHTP